MSTKSHRRSERRKHLTSEKELSKEQLAGEIVVVPAGLLAKRLFTPGL